MRVKLPRTTPSTRRVPKTVGNRMPMQYAEFNIELQNRFGFTFLSLRLAFTETMSLIIYEITFVRTETHESHKYDPKSEDKDACHVQTAGFSNYIGHIYVCTAAKVDRRTSGLRTRIEH